MKRDDPHAPVDHLRLDLLPLPVTPHRLRAALVAAARRAAADRERRALMRIHEEVSLWQASNNAVAHLRRTTAARLVDLLHAPGPERRPLGSENAEAIDRVCAEVRRVAALRAAPLRPEEVRALSAPGALPTARLAPVESAIAATARLLHAAMRAPERPRSEG